MERPDRRHSLERTHSGQVSQAPIDRASNMTLIDLIRHASHVCDQIDGCHKTIHADTAPTPPTALAQAR